MVHRLVQINEDKGGSIDSLVFNSLIKGFNSRLLRLVEDHLQGEEGHNLNSYLPRVLQMEEVDLQMEEVDLLHKIHLSLIINHLKQLYEIQVLLGVNNLH